MLLSRISAGDVKAFVELERYVNDGSPSGFTGGVSREFCPLRGAATFQLPVFGLPAEDATSFGDLRLWPFERLANRGLVPVPVHPDILPRLRHRKLFRHSPELYLTVAPTASGRTVVVLPAARETPFFIKLHYPRRIGRFVRAMPLFKWLASNESSHFLRTALATEPITIDFLDEFAGVFVEGGYPHGGFGTVFRRFPTRWRRDSGMLYIPAFALFSRDRRSTRDPSLLQQIVDDRQLALDEFVNLFLRPVVAGYHSLACTVGLLPELNAQNVVFGISAAGTVIITIRDMEDLWKDITVRAQKGLDRSCVRYHTIELEIDSDYYERRSFLYDFKLGEYLLRPLIAASAVALRLRGAKVTSAVKAMCREIWRESGDYFSPQRAWYSYPKEAAVSRARYERNQNPTFR